MIVPVLKPNKQRDGLAPRGVSAVCHPRVTVPPSSSGSRHVRTG